MNILLIIDGTISGNTIPAGSDRQDEKGDFIYYEEEKITGSR